MPNVNRERDSRDTVLFVAVPGPLGGSNRSLATLLEAVEPGLKKALASPPDGDFLALVRNRHLADAHVPLPHGTRVRRVMASFRILVWVLRHRARLLAIHANATRGLNLAAPAAILSGVPVVVWVHDPVGTRWGKRLGPILRALLRRVRWAAVSETARRVAVANGLCRSEDVEIVPNPLRSDTVVGNRKDPTDTLVIGYLGAGRHRKGFDLLPAIARALAGLPVELRLFTAKVDTPFSEPIWQEISHLEGIAVTNPGKNPDVRRVYEQCDIVLVPSREESFSMVTAEAMLNGIPVVASDLEPMSDLLLGGSGPPAGIVFPVEDASAAAAAIAFLVTSPDARAAMGQAGQQRAQEFDSQRVAARFLSLYRTPRRRRSAT